MHTEDRWEALFHRAEAIAGEALNQRDVAIAARDAAFRDVSAAREEAAQLNAYKELHRQERDRARAQLRLCRAQRELLETQPYYGQDVRLAAERDAARQEADQLRAQLAEARSLTTKLGRELYRLGIRGLLRP